MAFCLLLAMSGVAHTAHAQAPLAISRDEGRVSFMPQNQCAQSATDVEPYSTRVGCGGIGSAPYQVGNLTSHHGSVMHSPTNYLIFWLPPGYHFDTSTIDKGYSNASDSNYESLLGQYLTDLSSTAYYSIVQQYTDSTGAPGMTATFGGSWVDTSAYPNSEGTKSNPLQDSDLQSEVVKAINTNGWSTGNGNNVFFVLTGYNVYSCTDSTSCSFNTFCAYHGAFQLTNGQVVVYSNIPDPGSTGNQGSCIATVATGNSAPNTAFADSAVNLVAHEGFEAVTDPIFNGWFYQDTDHEIGDECAWHFGPIASDGSNLVLSGHRYLAQEMWSNRAAGCYIPPSVSTIQVIANYQVQGGGVGLAPPTITYYSGGVLTKTTLSATPQTLSIDFGTVWNATGTLLGSSSTERWQTGQATGGTVKAATILSFTYYHQYLVNFAFGVVGGGSGYSNPTLNFVEFGQSQPIRVIAGAASGNWVDAQSRYNFTSQLSSSSSSERWMTPASGGSVAGSGTISIQYYHQFLVPVSYSGVTFSPIFAYSSLGNGQSVPLGSQPQRIWVDAGASYSVTNPLAGSTGTDRWFTSSATGTISSANALQLVYYHQYLIAVRGGSVTMQEWFNSSVQASVTTEGVYARTSGTGLRVTAYQIDGGASQSVSPTTGPFMVSLQMNGPHTLDFSTVTQYQIGLDAGALAALSSITPPTVPGDAYWYDSGSSVSLVLNGVWGRDSFLGSRLASYALDGGTPVALASTGFVTVLSSVQISSPHSVTTVVTTQYRLSMSGGSVQSSTVPSILSDSGWYDKGTKAMVVYNYVWNQTQDSRSDALAVQMDGIKVQLLRSGNGTFQQSVVMDKPHSLAVLQVTQYRLSISGGSGILVSPRSPTGDNFYDGGSSVVVSSARIWQTAALTRYALVSSNLDGTTTQVPTAMANQLGNFSMPAITIDKQHQLVFTSATQYLVTFNFTDSSGSRSISPNAFEIFTSQPDATIDVTNSKAWIDANSTLIIKQLVWENVDVKPLNQVASITSPQNLTVAARVYGGVIVVSDYLGVPISGATADVQLANGTTITRVTGSDGTISIQSIPLGTLSAIVSYLGTSQGMSADFSQQQHANVRLLASLPDFAAMAGLAVVAGLGVYVFARRRRVSFGPTGPAE